MFSVLQTKIYDSHLSSIMANWWQPGVFWRSVFFFYTLHRSSALIYNASLAIHYAACDCHSSDFPLPLLPYVTFLYFSLVCLPPSFPNCSFNFSFSLSPLPPPPPLFIHCLLFTHALFKRSASSFHLPLPFFIMYSSPTHLSWCISATLTFLMS